MRREATATCLTFLCLSALLSGCAETPKVAVRAELIKVTVEREMTAHPAYPLPPRRSDYTEAHAYDTALSKWVVDSRVTFTQCTGKLDDINTIYGEKP